MGGGLKQRLAKWQVPLESMSRISNTWPGKDAVEGVWPPSIRRARISVATLPHDRVCLSAVPAGVLRTGLGRQAFPLWEVGNRPGLGRSRSAPPARARTRALTSVSSRAGFRGGTVAPSGVMISSRPPAALQPHREQPSRFGAEGGRLVPSGR